MIPGIFTQFTTVAGDIDDCWCYATMWAAEASRPGINQPTLTAFRAAAGDPDDGYRDGGSLDEVVRGARGSYDLTVQRFEGDFEGFAMALRAGRPASVAVLSSRLPLTYGFLGPHQIGVVWDTARREYVVANPLARAGTLPTPISEARLRESTTDRVLGYGGLVRAALFPSPQEDDMPGVVAEPDGPTVSGIFRVVADTQTIPTDGSTRGAIPKGAVRHAIGLYRLTGLADRRRCYLITEDGKPAFVAARAGSFARWERDDEAIQAAVAAAVEADRARARIVYG